MRLKKAEIMAIVVTLLFAALTIGFRQGRHSVPAQFAVRTTGEVSTVSPDGEDVVRSNVPVNINTATLEELCKLNGIGEALAQRIIDDREEHGPYTRIEDITRVSGIGDGTLAKLRDQITVE